MNRREERVEQVSREDLVLFINAAFACTRQHEFYTDVRGQGLTIEFLHDYILGNYRRLYARSLAAGVNHFNQSLILFNLLRTGAETARGDREEEGALIRAALAGLPPQRVCRLLETLRVRRVNNRRTRAVVRDYLASRPDPAFHAVKYRARVRSAARHAHLRLTGELGPFLFEKWKDRTFTTELFEQVRQAAYSQKALYSLPYTIAEGFARKHRLDQDRFLRGIGARMTVTEQLRMQDTAAESRVQLSLELSRIPLTRLALYVLSLSEAERIRRREELEDALRRSAVRAARGFRLGRVAAVLDRSFSASGSSEKRRRPLGVALGASCLLRVAAREYRELWTTPIEDPLLVTPRGQSDLATPLLDALEWKPDVVLIVSDGYENDPPRGVDRLVRAYRQQLDPEHRVSIVHLNPVFDADSFGPRRLSAALPTVGLRDAEDLPTMLGFARFADGTAPLSDLESYLAGRVERLLTPTRSTQEPPALEAS